MAAGGATEDEDEAVSLEEHHVCTSECPLLHSNCADYHGNICFQTFYNSQTVEVYICFFPLI